MARYKPTKRKPKGYRPNYDYFYVHPRPRADDYVFQHGRDAGLTWGAVRARNEAEGVVDYLDQDFLHWLLTNDFGLRRRGVWVRLDRGSLGAEDVLYLLDYDDVEEVFGPDVESDKGDDGDAGGPDAGAAGAASGSKRVKVG